ncbi:MAG TPA: aspartate aminotransferase family protein [Acidimicrobiia bacterium]|nr:aspartate aminotransferase family protein [Acidimicrobiia bacterium]
MTSVLEREAAAVMHTYGRTPIVFTEGAGTWLTDETGRRYLDFLTGLAVVSVGHANPRVADAVTAQMARLVHVSNLYVTEPMVRLAERLNALSGLDRTFFANCGATANEAAIKLARRWGQTARGPECFEVVSLLDSFHGRTLATLAATGQPAKQAVFDPLPPGFRQVRPGQIDELAGAVSASTAAVMIETTQGEGGVVPLDVGYLQAVRALCDERGILVIVDDVQAGVGRTGTWFSWQQLGFEPDIATTAKALANGLPIGACMATERVAAAFQVGDHATTFGGGPVVCAAAHAVLDEIESRDLLSNTVDRSAQLAGGLATLDGVVAVRGRGLLLAAVLDGPRANEVAVRSLGAGLIVNAVRPDAIRFAPPLTVSDDEVDLALDRFTEALG